ncbi:hypothetical protein GCHA_1562 [Paraglaciecola chathamensis S18K6]|uniref:Uncharacterized protein n=1 Tax=Paraglaciecola chathamensis S18K6 TaxID=1127672 RepID=A0AAV3UWU2_9ALTE|nr:hypothetical protein GCHA_1562 [Paraglaciecola chathamensis S18K6]
MNFDFFRLLFCEPKVFFLDLTPTNMHIQKPFKIKNLGVYRPFRLVYSEFAQVKGSGQLSSFKVDSR